MFRFQTVFLLFLVGLAIGLLFALQFRTPPRSNSPVSSLSALEEARDVLNKDQIELKSKITADNQELARFNDEVKKNTKASTNLVDSVEELRKKAGLTEIKDKGLVITLADSQTGETTLDSIVHASDIRDVINVLWQSGANAISVNDQRIVSTSSIDSIVNTILINNTKLTNPFVIKVAGNPDKIKKGLDQSQNLTDLLRRQKLNNLIFNVEKTFEVSVSAYQGSFVNNFAKIY